MALSKWSNYKQEVLDLRKSGVSLPDISKKYGIARSTLSYWFKDIELGDKEKNRIKLSASERMAKSRLKAAAWHRNQKQLRLLRAENEARDIYASIEKSSATLELALAMLYFGEGGKENSTTMGASDAFMLEFFLVSLENLYNLDRQKFRYDLHLRDDQNNDQLKQYWSSKLGVPVAKFGYVSKDPRTIGKPTKPGYMGVCQIAVGDISILRRLKALYRVYCTEVIRGD